MLHTAEVHSFSLLGNILPCDLLQFIYSPVDGQWAVSTLGLFWTVLLWTGYTSQCASLTLLDNAKQFPEVVEQISVHSHLASDVCSQRSTGLQSIMSDEFFQSDECVVVSHCHFSLYFLIINELKHICICLLANWISYLESHQIFKSIFFSVACVCSRNL